MISDPTYNRDEINIKPNWHMAFIMSECLNDSAPINWGKYIWIADAIIKDQKELKSKKKK